jgi:transcriptional regulator with XRE-family HTH domain
MLSKNIRSLRNNSSYTQAKIANYLDVTTSTIHQYENDARLIPAASISKLALLFNVEESELYQPNPQQQQILSVFAPYTNQLVQEDLKTISAFKKIVSNYLHLSEALAHK